MRLGPSGRRLLLLAASCAVAALPVPPAVVLLARAPVLFWLLGAAVLGMIRDFDGVRGAARAGASIGFSLALSATLMEALGLLGFAADLLPHVVALLLVPILVASGLQRVAAEMGAPGAGMTPHADGALASPDPAPRTAKQSRTTLDRVAWGFAIGCLVIGSVRGGTVAPRTDAGMQLALLVRSVETGLPVRESPFLAGAVPWQYADAWHRLLASCVVDPAPDARALLGIWNMVPGLVALATVLALALVVSELLGPTAAAVAVALQAAYLPFDGLGFPAGAGRVLLYAGLGLALVALRLKSPWIAGAVAVVGAGAAAVHPVECFLLALALVCLGVVRALLSRSLVAAAWPIGLGLLSLVLALPIVVLGNRFLIVQVAAHEVIDPGNELLRLLRGIYVVDPRYWAIDGGPWLLALGVLALPLVLRQAPEPVRSLVAALISVAVLGLAFPPIAALVVWLHVPTFLLSRTALLVLPGLFVAGALSVLGIERRPRTALLIAVLATLPALRAPLSTARPRMDQAHHPVLGREARARFESWPRGSVVLTDLWTADFLPIVGGHRAVAGITWHTASTRDQLAVRDFFSNPEERSSQALDLLRQRHVAAVAVTHWEGSGLDWPGYGSLFYHEPYSTALVEANPGVFSSDGRVSRPLPFRFAGKDAAHRADKLPETTRPLRALGDYDVVAVTRMETAVHVTLRARRPTRESPLVSVLAVPRHFDEHSPFARIVRALLGPRLTFALRRPPNQVRIDNRYYTPVEVEEGERMDVLLMMQPPPGYVLYVGSPEDLPSFPMPLLPALERSFVPVPE